MRVGPPGTSQVPSAWRAAVCLLAAGVFCVYLLTLAPGLTWAHHGADGGDLVTAAAVLGVAHPTGYPTYLLLARLFQFLPFGSLAYLTNLLSAVGAALASALAAVLTRRLCAPGLRYAWAGGLLAGLAFGLAPLVWSQAVIAEVHGLQAMFTAALLAGLPWRGDEPAGARGELGQGLLFGLALGNHRTAVLLLPPWLALTAWRAGRLEVRPALLRLAGLSAGLLVYLYIPLRALSQPPVNWGNAVSWDGFWWVVSGAPYRGLLFGVPPAELVARLRDWLGLLLEQAGAPGLALAAGGLLFGRTASRRVNWALAWVFLATVVFALGYQTADAEVYLIPAVLALAAWLGLGAARLLAAAAARWQRAAPALLALLAAWLLASAGLRLPQLDASRDSAAEDFGRAVMAQAPPAALIFTRVDRDTFAVWYFHFALRQRPDVAVMVEQVLGFAWYRESLRQTYPGLVIPAEDGGSWRAAILRAQPGRPNCETQLDQPAVLRCDP